MLTDKYVEKPGCCFEIILYPGDFYDYFYELILDFPKQEIYLNWQNFEKLTKYKKRYFQNLKQLTNYLNIDLNNYSLELEQILFKLL